MNNLAIIPARGGSKRIPRKNIKDFLGKPIIAYSIEAALKSGLFDEVMVSTDDKEIAEIAEKFGAKVPFMRSAEAANDYAPLNVVFLEVVEKYKEQGKFFDNYCLILPTAPLISIERLRQGYQILLNSDFDSVRPVVRFSFPIQRAFRMKDNNEVVPMFPELFMKRSQDLEPAFHDSGQFYWIRGGKDLSGNKGAFEIPELEAQDIDNEDDWKMAELKYKIKNKHTDYDCVFEEANLSNYDDYYAIRSEPTNIFWTGYSAAPDYEKFKQWYIERINDKEKFLYLVYHNNVCIGSLNIDIYSDHVMIGYSVKEEFQGKGYATCIVKKAKEIIFKNWKGKPIKAWVSSKNIASIKVLEKNGFRRTETTEYRKRFGQDILFYLYKFQNNDESLY